jgi:hypothetical protein
LHHLQLDNVIGWTSESLRPDGLLFINEPSDNNPFAKVGRKLTHDFLTKGEKHLSPSIPKKIANNHNMKLICEMALFNI